MKKLTSVQIENKKNYIKGQIKSGSGTYATLFIRTYYYILCRCRENNKNWCYGKSAGDNNVARYAYASVGNGIPDHMGGEIIHKIKQELNAMGYISFKLVDNTWRIYVNSPLDFLDDSIESYITDNFETNGIDVATQSKKVFDHLCTNGINIYSFERKCWKCGKSTTIYSYYIDVQIKHELGPSYSIVNSKILNTCNSKLFSTIGIGILPQIDIALAKRISTIAKRYSKTMDKSYYMNLCQHCNATQGINFTVFNPTELESMTAKDISKKKAFAILPSECNLDKEDLDEYFV